MKGWDMIHKIKALHDGGQGLSIRAISQELEVSRDTVRIYLRMDEEAIQTQHVHPERVKGLDAYREYIVAFPRDFAGMSSVKIARELHDKVGDFEVSNRCVRPYV